MTEVLGWETPRGQQPTLLPGVLGSALPQGILEGLWGVCLIPALIPPFGEESIFMDTRAHCQPPGSLMSLSKFWRALASSLKGKAAKIPRRCEEWLGVVNAGGEEPGDGGGEC